MISTYSPLLFFTALCLAMICPVKAEIDLSKAISAKESGDIKIPTDGLFDKTDHIIIDLSRLNDFEWCYPLCNGKLISPYGRRGGRMHTGIDIKTHANDTIVAAFSGRVRFAKWYAGYGNVMVVRHSTGLETIYSHNKKNLAQVGDFVKAGQPIAIEGRTGRATTEHCHFEIRINGRDVNPNIFFDTTNHSIKKERIMAYKSGKVIILSDQADKETEAK